jgi:hypothetical protein
MVVERIKQIIDYKKISTRQFCIEVGVANGFLDKVKDVGSEKLLKILNTYPELSPEWLLTGKGKMLKEEEVKKVAPQDLPTANDEVSTLLREKAAMLEAIIKEKEEKEAMYKEKIMALENELQEYKNLKKGYQQEEEEEDEIIEILPMAAEPASIPAELLKAKQGEYRRI